MNPVRVPRVDVCGRRGFEEIIRGGREQEADNGEQSSEELGP